MKLLEYQDAANKTSVYPGAYRRVYPILGFIGEVGELTTAFESGTPDEVTKEMGDVLWYLANISTDCGLFLDDLYGVDNFSDIKPLTGVDQWSLIPIACRLAEIIKKYIRDDNSRLTPHRRTLIIEQITKILPVISGMAQIRGLDLGEVAATNIAKLKSRQQRGVIKGDGDNR